MTRQEEQEIIKQKMEETATEHPELQELAQMVIDAKLTPQQLRDIAAAFRHIMGQQTTTS